MYIAQYVAVGHALNVWLLLKGLLSSLGAHLIRYFSPWALQHMAKKAVLRSKFLRLADGYRCRHSRPYRLCHPYVAHVCARYRLLCKGGKDSSGDTDEESGSASGGDQVRIRSQECDGGTLSDGGTLRAL